MNVVQQIALQTNDVGKSDCVSQVTGFESSDDNSLDEFSQTEEFMNAQYI